MPEIVKCYALIAAAIGTCIFIASFFLLAYSGMCMDAGSEKALKLNKLASKIMIITAVILLCGFVIMLFLKILLTKLHCF